MWSSYMKETFQLLECVSEDPWKWVAILKDLNARFPRLIHKWVSRINSLIPSYDFHLSLRILKWKQLVSWTKCQMHALNWSKLHPNIYEIQGQIDHLKAFKTSHAPPFWEIFFYYGPHPFEIPKNPSLAYNVYKLIYLQNKIILICFWAMNQSKRSITKGKMSPLFPSINWY
jgi:hypothetical protein